MNVPLASAVIATARETPTWLVGAASTSAIAEEVLRNKGVEVLRAEADGELFDLPAVLALLAQRGITRLMVEGGAAVAASLVKADLVDEAVLFHGSKPIGPDGVDALDGLPLTALTQSPRLRLDGSEELGGDRLEHWVRA